MDIEPQFLLQTLQEHSSKGIGGSSECHRLLTIINYNLTEEQLNTSLIDMYILYIFDKSNGLYEFILRVSSNADFDNVTVKALEIIYTLINNFSAKVAEFILDINAKSLLVLRGKGSAKVKTKVMDILIVSFEKVDKCLEHQEQYLATFECLKNYLIQAIHSDLVRHKEFIAIGLFAKRFSYLIADPKLIKHYFINELETQMVKGPAQTIIYGIFTGLCHFCQSFALISDNQEDASIINKLYKFIKELSNPRSDRTFGNRAAINFFGTHTKVFKNMLLQEYKQWHKRLLLEWLNLGVEDKKIGEQALNSLLLTIAHILTGTDKNQCQPILKHFLGWFKSILRNSNATYTERKLCVQGLKYFSTPLYEHYSQAEAKEIFLMIMQSFEKLYIINGNTESEEWEFLPDYVQCLAGFMRYQSFSNSEVYYLQRAIISMIKTFDKLKPLHYSIVIDAFVTTLFYLKETKHIDSFLENIIYQGVVWTCSHQHITDAELQEVNVVTVKNYFPLWFGLFKLVGNRTYDKVAIYIEDRQHIVTKVVNELVKTLMILINKLNVNVKLKEDLVQTDLEVAYEVEQPNDFNIFLNVTDFYEEVLNKVDPSMFKDCICRIMNHMVAKCLKYPLVSGFYKLLSFAMKIANELRMFDKGNLTLNQDIINCKETLSKFMMYLLHKMKQFKDELLISCLHVMLESPVVIMKPLLSECAGIFAMIFELGRSYLALANMGLNTLERWQQCIDQNEFESFLIQVIPCLDSYLRSKSLGGFSQVSTASKKRKTELNLKKRTVLIELEPELVKFQRRVLYFVGSQSSKVCQAFVSPDNNFERKVTSDNLLLKVSLPYNDMVMEIYLEPFIMRVVELSLYSSDRKSRIMACELLQAFVVIFLGRTKSLPHCALSDLSDLLKSIAFPLLQLACDIDQVVKQIYEPLFMQIIHWYTSKSQAQSPHLAVIIEVLMDGITHPTNSSLRDFSGKCINEFVKWTIKQNSENDLKNNPVNIKVLVKRMRFFSSHPDLVKKQGAALIFNNIYKEFREEQALISIFSLELLHIFILSLSLLDNSNEGDENAAVQINKSILHLKRIFLEKSAVFRNLDNQRRIPSDIPEGTLQGLCKWLLTMTANRSKYCRDSTMDLFVCLQPICGSKESLSTFVEHNANDLMSLYSEILRQHPTIEDINAHTDTTLLLKWLEAFLCLIDGYIFIVKNSLCTFNLEERHCITYFLKNVQHINIEQGLKLMCKDLPLPYFTAINKEQFSSLKSSCCLAILKLANAFLNNEPPLNEINNFWQDHFWTLIANIIFNPSLLGFNDKINQLDYQDVLVQFLNKAKRKLGKNQLDDLASILKAYVKKNFDDNVDIRRSVSLKQRNIIKGLLLIESTQLNTVFCAEIFSVGLTDKLLNNFLTNSEQGAVYVPRLSEATSEYCVLLFKFALSNPEEYPTLLQYIFSNTTSVNCEDITGVGKQIMLGEYLLKKFADPLVNIIINKFQLFLEASDTIDLIVKLTSTLLSYLETNRSSQYHNDIDNVSENIAKKWFIFEKYFEDNSVDFGLDFIKQIKKVFGAKFSYGETIQKWIVSLLCKKEILLHQQEEINLYLNIFNILTEVTFETEVENLSAGLEKVKTMLEPALVDNTNLTEKLIINLVSVKNHVIFDFLIDFYVDNATSDMDLSKPIETFMNNNSEEFQKSVLNSLYNLAIRENKSFEQKKKIADNVISDVFKNSLFQVFESFFEDNIRNIIEDLQNPNHSFANSLINFSLLELLFLRIPIGSEEREFCSITESSGIPKLRAQLLKLALDAFRNTTNEGNKEHIRLFKCGAYKALASIISNSIKTETFYEKLFIREEKEQDILWCALVDLDVVYNFSVDLDSYPKRRKILINIRDELRQQNEENKLKSLRYIESQRLVNSSLSEDISKFDFTNSILRVNPATNQLNADEHDREERLNVDQLETRFIQGELYLEGTEINNHSLMGTVCGVIAHIFNSGICQLPENPEEMMVFPNWMNGIVKLLLNPHTHRNIKIFWIKVIDNMIHIFRHFAKYFLEPLLQFVNDKVAGNDLNYFVSDVIVILASWTKEVQPNEKEAQLAQNFLNHVIKNLSNDRKDVFKYNLEMIKLIIENWNNFVKIPHDTLYSKLIFDIEDRKIEVGLHLTSIFLANGILPCDPDNVKNFWKKLLQILNSSVSTIYKPCAETIGLMLKYFQANEMEMEQHFSDVKHSIQKFQKLDKYAACLEGIAIHYVEIVDEYHIIKMLNHLSTCNPNMQITFLKIICKSTKILGEIHSFKTEDWDRFLESQNAEVQLITLEIILKTFEVLQDQKSFKTFIKSASKNVSNPNIFCRSRMYDIMMAILTSNSIEDDDVISICNNTLVQGLVDTDNETRERVRQFWSENPTIPKDISSKFPFLMSKFYLARTEDHFLGYVSYFLLDNILNEEYEKEMFDHPLEDCNFEEYQLQTNWRLQHPSVVPLFAETLRSYSDGQGSNFGSSFEGLRATQNNLTFAPTQQTVRERHISQITSLQSSLFGTPLSDSSDVFLNPNTVQISDRYKLPKKRFLKDKAKISKNFAHLAVSQKIQKIVKRYDAAKESEKKVTIYRNYRKGDFPDIQITLGSLIKPLQMLILHDSELSKIFFSVMYKTLKTKVKNNETFTTSVLEGIKSIFRNSTQYNSNVFSTMLDILLKSKQEFRVDPALISTVSQQSGLISVGALLIEEYLMDMVENEAGTSKRGCGSENMDIRHWLKLAELYKELNEWNLVQTIFLEKTNCKDDVQKAIILESEKKWRDAQERYEKLLETDPSVERQDFYYESYFKCLAHLGEWEKLPRAVESLVPEGGEKTWDSLWDNGWYQQKILPWFVGAKIKNILFTRNEDKQFLSDINKSLNNPEQGQHLKNKFSEELSILWLTQKDTAQAAQYLKNGLENLLSDWQLLNPMFGNLRYDKVLNLRTLIEIERFLQAEKLLSEANGEETLKLLQNYWKSTKGEFLPSIILSEARLLYRKLFTNLFVDKLTSLNQTELVKEQKKTDIILDIAFMNLAVEEENYYMTRKYYRNYAAMKHPSLTMIYGNLAILWSNLIKNDPSLQLSKLLEGLRQFKKIVQTSQSNNFIASLLKIVEISEKVTDILSNNPNMYGTFENQLQEIFGTSSETPLNIACESLKTEVLKDSNNKDDIDQRIKAFTKLAYFVKNQSDRDKDFILYVLKSMKLGSKEARQLFPCILLKNGLESDLKNVFVNECRDIPTWMFLGWIPQLLANVDSLKVGAISEILIRLARTYPQAVMYSYRLSKENYANNYSECEDDTKQLIEELDKLLLNDPLIDTFLTALAKVSVPIITLEYYIKKMAFVSDIEEFLKHRDLLLDFFFEEASNSKDVNSMQGNIYKTVKQFKRPFEQFNQRQALNKAKDELKKIEMNRKKVASEKHTLSSLLKDFCPWLANFSAGRFNLELEIPGQYTGDKLPLVQHHIKISGFCQTVSVMSSLRKPVKVTMLGMNGKEYPFLIKFGEDVRQDQRIQQLFMLMNDIFANDNKDHLLMTYQVVPLKSSLGIIQWVENTVSLDSFIFKTIKSASKIINSLQSKFKQFMNIKNNLAEEYGLSALKKDRDEIIRSYRELTYMIPLDALRMSIWSLSLTTESFIAFRDNFIKSYATICICHWILGIGDRHLQNSKVCTWNGKVLGIDFGHAFGTATQILAIPELVPIRLTPHLVSLMEPLKERGLLRHVMVECLRSLRENSSCLLATMNVFIQEPSVDWLDQAKRHQTSNSAESCTWYPLQKVDQAKKKLTGASSASILIEDLRASNHGRGVKQKSYFDRYVSYVQGDPQFDLRARLANKEFLSVEEQIDSLIDHATDENLLGRMYVGWQAAV